MRIGSAMPSIAAAAVAGGVTTAAGVALQRKSPDGIGSADTRRTAAAASIVPLAGALLLGNRGSLPNRLVIGAVPGFLAGLAASSLGADLIRDVRPGDSPQAPVVTTPKPDRPQFDRVLDFPGFAAGQRLQIAEGSTAQGWSVRGEAKINALAPDGGAFWVKAGRFGISKEADIAIRQVSPTAVEVKVHQQGSEPTTTQMDIVDVRQGFSQFQEPGNPHPFTMQTDARGRMVIDFVDGDTNDQYHFILQR